MKKTSKTIVGSVDADVLAFTAADDAELDANLVRYDCIGTAAHVIMLSKIKGKRPVITHGELKKVIKALQEIVALDENGRFLITESDQDVHMAVERHLTARLGKTGKKVHTARSRNDQSALDMRMYLRDGVLAVLGNTIDLAGVMLAMASRCRNVPMAGRTHFMPAMPSTVGLWAASYAEALADDADMLKSVFQLINRCPLGSAAGYGVPVNINRKLTAALLAFDGPVNNVLTAGASRGKVEAQVLAACSLAMLTLSRLAEDTILYSAPEFGYFELPAEFCTGSSIMPQKKNPDVLELIRARASVVRGCASTVSDIVCKLPWGYNRDLQETKEPAMKGVSMSASCMNMAVRLFSGVNCNRAALEEGLVPEVFATDLALKYVAEGIPFRAAYDRVKRELAAGFDSAVIEEALASRSHLGSAGNLNLKECSGKLRGMYTWLRKACLRIDKAEEKLLSVK